MSRPSAEAEQSLPVRLVLHAFEHRHEVVHLLYAAVDRADATRRIASLLQIDQPTAAAILDLPLRRMLPEERARAQTPAGAAQPLSPPS